MLPLFITSYNTTGNSMVKHVGYTNEEVSGVYKELGSVKATARHLGINRSAVQWHLRKSGITAANEALDGLVQNKKPEDFPLPPEGEVYRYLISSAQSNTKVYDTLFKNLEAAADYYVADIFISRVTYNKSKYAGSAKPGTAGLSDADEMWFDPRIDPYTTDDRIKLAPGLVFVGDMNILPTATNPLSGLEAFTGRASGIFPHPKIAMESIPSAAHEPAKYNYTTGAVTQRNYIQMKAGQKAEFHHAYGALIVEVESDGSWWVRQLNADGRGGFMMLMFISTRGKPMRRSGPKVLPPVTYTPLRWTRRTRKPYGARAVSSTRFGRRNNSHTIYSPCGPARTMR